MIIQPTNQQLNMRIKQRSTIKTTSLAADEARATGCKLLFVHDGVFDVQTLLIATQILFLPNYIISLSR
jgi:hypothetical protein